MAATLVRKVMLKIAADDGDTESKLDKISEKADELARKHPDLKVKVDTAAAAAKLAVLRRELKSTDDQGDKARVSLGGLGQVLNTSLLGGISGNVGEMTMFQKALAGLNVATGLGEPLMAGLIVSTMGLAAGLTSAGLGAGVFGLAAESAFSQVTAANTAGVKLTGGLGELQRQLKTATGQWDQFGKAASPGVARVMAGALKLIPDALKLAQPFLAPTEKALGNITAMLGKGMSSAGAKSWFGAFAASSGADLQKVAVAIGRIGVGLGGLLKAFLPVSGTMLTDLDKITGKFASWGSTLTGHSGFQSLMAMFKSDTPVVLGLLKNLAGIAKTVISEMTGMNTASNSRTLIQVANAVSGLVNNLLKAHPQLVEFVLYLKLAADSGKKLGGAVSDVSKSVKALSDGKKAISDFSAGFGDAQKAADKATGAAGTYGGQVSKILQKLGILKASQAEAAVATDAETVATEGEAAATGEAAEAQEGLNVAMSLNPIGLIVIAIAGLVVAFAELWKHSAAFRDFWKAAWKDIQGAAVAAWHFIDGDMIHPLMSGIDKLVSFVRQHWLQLAALLLGPMAPVAELAIFIAKHWTQIEHVTSELADKVRGFFTGMWHDVTSTVSRWVGDVIGWVERLFDEFVSDEERGIGRIVSWFEGLPGRVMNAIGDLAGMLYKAGIQAIKGLINGVGSMISSGVSTLEGWGHDLASAITHPFGIHLSEPSEAAIMIKAGKNATLGLAKGMTSERSAAIAAGASVGHAAMIGATARPGYGTAAYGGAAGGAQKLQLQLNIAGGSSAFRTFLKKTIRVTGGSAIVVGS